MRSLLLYLVPGVMALVLLGGCKEATLEPDLYGGIQGTVFDFESKAPLSGASVTTSPPTSALFTDENGRFGIDEVPEGNYTISATRPGYQPNSVTVSVRENRTTQAAIFLDEEEPDSLSAAAMTVDIVNWASRTSGDSSFVDVEYRVTNTGRAPISAYEVYFRIDADSLVFLQEEQGTGLNIGQVDIGGFEKYTRQALATGVAIDDYWYQRGTAQAQ